jgi:hypothetical protein
VVEPPEAGRKHLEQAAGDDQQEGIALTRLIASFPAT